VHVVDEKYYRAATNCREAGGLHRSCIGWCRCAELRLGEALRWRPRDEYVLDESLLRQDGDAERTLSRVIAHRVWVDQRRGWRFTNPSLEELGLVRAQYVGLDELAADDAAFENGPAELRVATPGQRRRALLVLLETLRSGLAVTADEAYVRESILNPRAKVVAGYQPIMPTFQGQLSEEQVIELLVYVRSLGPKQSRPEGSLPVPPRTTRPACGSQQPA
jgi:hypothetical protein